MIRIAAKLTVRADACEEFEKSVRELIELTRAEEGNHGFTIARSVENPQLYCFFEAWGSQEALEQHLNSEHFLRISPKLDALMESAPEGETYEEI